jgi:hypothetical protein
MRRTIVAGAIAVSLAACGAATAAEGPGASDARLLTWTSALDAIDMAVGVGTAGDVPISIVCVFASPACEAAKRVAQRAVMSYRRVAMRSWKARGMKLPSKCFTFEIDGAQIDRVLEAYERARPNLAKGGSYLLTAYDLLGYGFIPVSDLECQDTARSEILRVRGMTDVL